MQIVSVDIVGLRNFKSQSFTFSPVTYLVGPIGKGKTTVLNAIQLALLGYIPGQHKKAAQIMRNANTNTITIAVKLMGDRGEVTVTRTFIKKAGGSATSELIISPEDVEITDIVDEVLELPMFNLPELVNMAANQQKDFFINNLLSASSSAVLTRKQVEEKIQAEIAADEIPGEYVHGIIDDMLQHYEESVTDNKSALTCVQELNDYAKELKSLKKYELNSAISSIQNLSHYDDFTCAYTKDQLEAKIKELEEDIAKYEHYQRCLGSYKSWLAEKEAAGGNYEKYSQYKTEDDIPDVQAYRDAYEEYDKHRIKYNEEIEIIQDKIVKNAEKSSDMKAKIEQRRNIIRSSGNCPYTNEICEKITGLFDTLEDEIKALTADLEAVRRSCEELEDMKVATRRNLEKYKDAYTEAKVRSDAAVREYNNIQSILKREIKKPTGYEKYDVEKAKQELAAFRDMLVKLLANEEYSKLSDTLLTNKTKVEYEISAIDIVAKLTSANRLQLEIMNEPFLKMKDDLSVYISDFLGEDVKCSFILSETSNSFSFGILRDGKHIPFTLLSSGEKCLYTLAFLTCIVKNTKKLPLILLDDALDHVDDETAVKIFRILQKEDDIQYILAGVSHLKVAKEIEKGSRTQVIQFK